MDRRTFLRTGLVATAACTWLGACSWRRVARTPPRASASPYGPLLPPDANGLLLPPGFRSRMVARARAAVEGTSYRWHVYPDGGATFAAPDGGWIYVSNSEVGGRAGGASAIRFAADGRIADAYRILGGTSRNCAGGPTPWGTWLSCEEHDAGLVWECDPRGDEPAVPRPALGRFQHEAAAVDPAGRRLYMTEDQPDGLLYRFTPDAYPSLEAGTLEAMRMDGDGRVGWIRVPDPDARAEPTRRQPADASGFAGGEGCWFDAVSRTFYFATKGDDRVWALDVPAQTIEVLYDGRVTPAGALSGVDNVTVGPSGDVLVAEDGGDMQIVALTGEGLAAPLLQVAGQQGSEITGPAFDPAGRRLYFSSQRGEGTGITYEVTGPFRR